MAQTDPRSIAPTSAKAGDSPAKIKDAAQQFEGLLISQLLSDMHPKDGWLGTEDSSSSAATGFAEQQLSGVIAKNGGLGLSKMIAEGLTRQSAAAQANAEASAPASGATPPSRP